jgi:hypothetical protein
VRRRLEREGVSGGDCCRGKQRRRRLQGKAAAVAAAAAGEVRATEGAGQGAKPSVAAGEGGGRRQQRPATCSGGSTMESRCEGRSGDSGFAVAAALV